MDINEVYNGLIEVIDKFENEILMLDPQSALDRANLEQYDRENKLAFADELQEEIEVTKGSVLKSLFEMVNNEMSSDSVDDETEKFDDFITKGDNGKKEENIKPKVQLQLAKDQTGKFYVMTNDPENPKIVASFN